MSIVLKLKQKISNFINNIDMPRVSNAWTRIKKEVSYIGCYNHSYNVVFPIAPSYVVANALFKK